MGTPYQLGNFRMPNMRSLTDYEEIPILKPFVCEMSYKPLSAPRLILIIITQAHDVIQSSIL